MIKKNLNVSLILQIVQLHTILVSVDIFFERLNKL